MKSWLIRLLPPVLAAFLLFAPAPPARAESAVPEQESAESTPAPAYETLASGAKGDAVSRLQQRLIDLGYEPGVADGVFGAGTRKAIKAFQRANGLEDDGVAGPITQSLLFSDQALPAPPPPEPVNVLAGNLPYLVNHTHPVAEDFVPADLVPLAEICPSGLVRIKYERTQAVREAAEALVALLQAAKADGVTRWQISAAYRSYEDQESQLNAKINYYLSKNEGWGRSRARSAALKTVAEPGHSEHHLGLAFDINVPGASSFLGTKQCAWLHKHCWEHGFILRYPNGKEKITGFAAEAWHIRYVGAEHAGVMREHDWCLEEYLDAIEQGFIDPPVPEIEENVDLD